MQPQTGNSNQQRHGTHPLRDIAIGVLGLGHVGLPTALGFAELGWQVIGADDNEAKTRLIAAGVLNSSRPRWALRCQLSLVPAAFSPVKRA